MLLYLIILFTAVPIVELALLIKLGQIIGLGNTLAIVIFTGIGGAILAKSQGLRTLRRIDQELSMGIMPSDPLFDGLFILCGGLLLITPGIITDMVGLLLLTPFFRASVKIWIKKKIRKAFQEGRLIRIIHFRSD